MNGVVGTMTAMGNEKIVLDQRTREGEESRIQSCAGSVCIMPIVRGALMPQSLSDCTRARTQRAALLGQLFGTDVKPRRGSKSIV